MTTPTTDALHLAADWLDAYEGDLQLEAVADMLRKEAAKQERKQERAALREHLVSKMEEIHPGMSKTPEGKAILRKVAAKFTTTN